MSDFNKLLISKLIALVVIVTFSVTSTAYGVDLSEKRHLRKPLLFNDSVSNETKGLALKITPLQLYKKLKNVIAAKTLVSPEVVGLLYSRYKDYFDSHPDLNPMNTELKEEALLRIVRDLFNPFFKRRGFRIFDFFSGIGGSPVLLSENELEKVGYKGGGLYTYGIDNQIPWAAVSAKDSEGIIRMDVMDLLNPSATIPVSCVDVVTVFKPEHLPKEKIIATVDDVAPIVKAARKILKPGGWIYITPAPHLNHKNDHYLLEKALKDDGFVNIEAVSHPGMGLYKDAFKFYHDITKPNYLVKAQKPFSLLDKERQKLFKISQALPTSGEVIDVMLKHRPVHPEEMDERFTTRIFPEGRIADNIIILKNELVFCDVISKTSAYGVYIVDEDVKEDDVMFSSTPYYGCIAALFKGERDGKTVLAYFHLEVETLDLKATLMEVFEKVESLKLDNLHVLIDVMPSYVGRVKDIANNSKNAPISKAYKEGDILINGIMYKKGGQDRETQIFGTKEGFGIIDAGKDMYFVLWDEIKLINQDKSKNSIKQLLFKKKSLLESMSPAENSSLASNETMLNSKGESFGDIWEWLRERKLTHGEKVRDPRRLPILPEEKEFAEAYAKMSLKDLQDDVLVDLIKAGMVEGCGWMLKKKDPLQTFIDGLNTVDYDITIQRIKSAESRVQTSKGDIENSKKRGNYNNKKKRRLNEKLLNSYKYRAFLRELTNRWRKPTKEDSSIHLLGIISKPGQADTSL